MVRRYVDERAEHLAEAGVMKAPALFPNLLRESGYYSAQRFRVIKQKIVEASGVDFRLKDFRSTLTTVTVNGDLSRLPAMGMQLRHQNPETIGKYYADIERSNIGRQLRPAWSETPIRPISQTSRRTSENEASTMTSKNTAIDSKFEVTGYV
jgi:integrase/recombinase XerD